MWLDRLSGHSSNGYTPSSSPPPPNNRTYSPAPRRSGHLAPTSTSQRPGYGPRSSSLSLISNDSTSSLLSSSKRVNGSGLKHTVSASAPDPLTILDDILGARTVALAASPGQHAQIGNPDPQSDGPDENLDFGGMSMRELVGNPGSSSTEAYTDHTQSPAEYERDKQKFEDLHRSIRACDDVLSSVEINLANFQNDLAAVSAEIETLQAHSAILNKRLENRKVVETTLGPIVEDISVPPSIVKKIVEGVVDESWVRALIEVERKHRSLETKSRERSSIKAVENLKPLLENVVNKALERIRDFMVIQIKALRSPNINAQIIQQQQLFRYKDLFAFLHKHHRQLAEEIAQAYMNTMRWYFLTQFTRYQRALETIRLHTIDKSNVLGQDDGHRKSSLLSSSTTKVSGPPHDTFNIGRRLDLLRASNQMALSSFLAEEDQTTHYLEFPFRNFNLALVDNASAEYSFLTSFFSPCLSYSAISRHFQYIFEPTFALGQGLTKSLISDSYDCLGILLCVRLNQHFAFELQRRKNPACDGYINGTSMLLWPRFQKVMDQHCESVHVAMNTIPTRKQTASEQAKQSLAPHFMTQRFGQFICSLLSLSTEAGDDEPVLSSLIRLRNEVEAFLTKLSKAIGDARKRERFLYNNYSLILTIIGDVDGKQALEQQGHFQSLKDAFGVAA